MSSIKEYLVDLQNENAEEWIRQRLEDQHADEESDELIGGLSPIPISSSNLASGIRSLFADISLLEVEKLKGTFSDESDEET